MTRHLFITAIACVCSCMFSVLSSAQEKIILLNEGMWQADNGRMTYFEDAEPQPMPFMFENVDWEKIKQHIKEKVELYIRKHS